MTMTTDREVRELVAGLPGIDNEARSRLHARLVAAAERDGIPDVAYRTIDTPVGTLLLAATEGLARLAYAREDHDVVLARLAEAVSYAEVAAAAGSPKAVRAVGTACATNPLPVVVPCHRVVCSDGSFGGYVGGPEAKQVLLNLEAAA